MIAPDFMDELDCGSFFDHIDDLLVDFSGDDVDDAGGGGGLPGSKPESKPFPSIWSAQSDSLPNSDSVFSGHSASADLSAELSVPYEDIVQLEWLSNFVEDSFSGGESLTINREQQDASHHHSRQFQTSSPISVLESSSSCSGGDKSTVSGGPDTATPGGRRGRARSKRPRPASFNPRPSMHLIDGPTSEDTAAVFVPTPKNSSDSDSFAESRPKQSLPLIDHHHHYHQHPKIKKAKKIKLTFPPPAQAEAGAASVRKCMHCEITKTPQWRAGPMGPKTLCNACGVRFKSGRLFPEYRPAASPTFVASLHSNSHKKVLEMRGKDHFDSKPASGLVPNTSLGYI